MSKTPKASVFTESQYSGKTFRHVPVFPATGMGCGQVVPCEYALPPPLEIVGGKISGIRIEEITFWPLEPLSATPPQFCGGSKGPPPPPPSKIFTSPGARPPVCSCVLTIVPFGLMAVVGLASGGAARISGVVLARRASPFKVVSRLSKHSHGGINGEEQAAGTRHACIVVLVHPIKLVH